MLQPTVVYPPCQLRDTKFFLFLNQEAQQRLEENHREKVTRVMKDWSDLEERYQDMRLADPKSAQTFKQKMTARFQVVYFAPTFLSTQLQRD